MTPSISTYNSQGTRKWFRTSFISRRPSTMRSGCESLANAPPQLFMITPCRARHRGPRLHMRDSDTRRHQTIGVTIDKLQNPSRKQLDFPLTIASLRVLLRMGSMRPRCADGGFRGRRPRAGQVPNIRDKEIRSTYIVDQLLVCKDMLL